MSLGSLVPDNDEQVKSENKNKKVRVEKKKVKVIGGRGVGGGAYFSLGSLVSDHDDQVQNWKLRQKSVSGNEQVKNKVRKKWKWLEVVVFVTGFDWSLGSLVPDYDDQVESKM